jgi:hypothetical protein
VIPSELVIMLLSVVPLSATATKRDSSGAQVTLFHTFAGAVRDTHVIPSELVIMLVLVVPLRDTATKRDSSGAQVTLHHEFAAGEVWDFQAPRTYRVLSYLGWIIPSLLIVSLLPLPKRSVIGLLPTIVFEGSVTVPVNVGFALLALLRSVVAIEVPFRFVVECKLTVPVAVKFPTIVPSDDEPIPVIVIKSSPRVLIDIRALYIY